MRRAKELLLIPVIASGLLVAYLLTIVSLAYRRGTLRTLAGKLLLTAIALPGLFIAYTIGTGAFAYLFALGLEADWYRTDPKTRAELERHLSFYSTRLIEPSRSMWGHRTELECDQRMVQYLLLWSAPLDVVYDSNDRIVRLFTSYE